MMVAVSFISDVVLQSATDSNAFRFPDGRICLPRGGGGEWWTGSQWDGLGQGPVNQTAQNAIMVSGSEIYSPAFTARKQSDGRYLLECWRSFDRWQSFREESSIVVSPDVVPAGGDDGNIGDGLMFHHGLAHLRDGGILAAVYGNFAEDKRLADGYPSQFNFCKYRTVALVSQDGGRSWSVRSTIAARDMLARGLSSDPTDTSTIACPAVTQEGFCEPDLVRSQNGQLLCFMRSGGRLAAKVAPTPLYMSSSSDEGYSWTAPVQVHDFGVCPNAVTLSNGLTVLVFSRPGSWLKVSDDNGASWSDQVKLSNSDSYVDLVQVGYDRVMVFCSDGGYVHGKTYRVYRQSEDNRALLALHAYPPVVHAGKSAALVSFGQHINQCTLSGGPWGSGASVGADTWGDTGPLDRTTTFTMTAHDASTNAPVRATLDVQVI